MKKTFSFILGLTLVFSFIVTQAVFAADGVGGGAANEGQQAVDNEQAASSDINNDSKDAEGGGGFFGGIVDAVGSAFGAIGDFFGSAFGAIGDFFGGFTGSKDVGFTTPSNDSSWVEPPLPGPLSITFSANKERVNKGEDVVLSWDIKNADSCKVSGDYWKGEKATKGSETVKNLQVNQVFTFTCLKDSISKSKTVFIEVAGSDISYETALNSGAGSQVFEPNPNVAVGTVQSQVVTQGVIDTPDQPTEKAPVINLIASAKEVEYGKPVTLSWRTQNAIYCRTGSDWPAPQGSLGTRSYKPISGSQQVTMTSERVFTIACSNSSGVTTTSSLRVLVLPQVVVPAAQ